MLLHDPLEDGIAAISERYTSGYFSASNSQKIKTERIQPGWFHRQPAGQPLTVGADGAEFEALP